MGQYKNKSDRQHEVKEYLLKSFREDGKYY